MGGRKVSAVPFTNLAATTREAWPLIEHDYLACMNDANYIGGAAVQSFEHDWATYCGAHFAVGVANGTDALRLALTALGIGPGDEVIVPSNTFIATAAAVVHAGAIPRFADVSEETLLLTPDTLREAITTRTRAVIVVHLYGQMPDMTGLLAVADDAGLLVVEDAAQAHGAEWAGLRAGSFGAAACFSFYPGKNLGAFGDAGAVVTNRQEVADRIRALANHGRSHDSSHYQHDILGENSRLDALQAIVLSGKLALLEKWTQQRTAAVSTYRESLKGADVQMIEVNPLARHVYHLFVVRVADRDWVRQELSDRGIQTGVHYPTPCHLQSPLQRYADRSLPVSERAAQQALSLPLFPHMTDEHIDTVCRALREALSQTSRTEVSLC